MSAGFTHESTSSITDTWLTPPWLLQKLGSFDLDPCGHPLSDTAARKIILPEDGLQAPWEGRVWLNPPYGPSTEEWLSRLSVHGDGIALVFARTETRWFQTQIRLASAALFVRGRLRFFRADGTEGGTATAPSVLLAYGETCGRILLNAEIKGWKVNLCGER